ncbi:hypothetical protein RMCBS344292_07125 [Rhizopus microsporus]|nr:hypothetical protein RMCBS344292_07125 [Rhizopus microsporus]
MTMQAFQHQYSNNNNNDNNNNCTNFESVREFLNHCHLSQYYDIFISEGFDSISSLLEITEEDMIVMNIKRGHRRLIQREIATAKGIPRDQPLVTNIMGPKYSLDIPSSLKVEHSRGPTANYASSGYETLITGMTSPRSMNSGMGGSNTSGNSSSNNSGPNPTSRFIPPNMAALIDNHNNNNNNDNNGNSNNDNNNAKNSIDTIHGGRSSSRSSSTNKIIPNQPIIRSTSISSNEDSESVQSDSTAPKRKYRRHAKPDRNAPIKPPSAYIMFSNDSRAKLKDQNLSFAELAKVVGEQWKNLSYYEKQAYERKAMRAKDEYLAALERYRETDEYKRYQQYLKEFKAKQESANRLIDRARKRAKQKSPGSGSAADASSNGNSTGNGSSGSSGDNNDKDSMQSMSQTKDSPSHRAYIDQPMTNDYQDVEDYRHQQQEQQQHQEQQEQPSSSSLPEQQHPQWNYRSDQMMRGIIPVEFVHTPQPKYSNNNNDNDNPNNLQVLNGSKHPLDTNTPYQERPHKRRSPRLRKSSSE